MHHIVSQISLGIVLPFHVTSVLSIPDGKQPMESRPNDDMDAGEVIQRQGTWVEVMYSEFDQLQQTQQLNVTGQHLPNNVTVFKMISEFRGPLLTILLEPGKE